MAGYAAVSGTGKITIHESMIGYLKEIAGGFFILWVAFNNSIYFILQAGLELPAGRALFQIYSGCLTIVTLFLYIKNIDKIPHRVSIEIFLISAAVILFFFATRIYYGYTNSRYQGYFLSMGTRFIPGILIGAYMLSDEMLLQRVEKALFPFICLYTIILAQVVFTAEAGVNVVETFNLKGGMNYQNMSYYSIYMFGLTLYLINHVNYSGWFRYILVLLAFLQIVMTLTTGGRGAFVLLVVFMLYYGLKNFSLIRMVMSCLLVILICFLIQTIFSDNMVFQIGFNRVFNFFSNAHAIENDGRWIRWGLAWDAFLDSPLWGHGLGSVFYEIGFYSHNLFTDMLCEGGVILTGIFLYCLFRFCKRAKEWIKTEPQNEIVVTIFLCSFIMCCFSGYYLSESGLWFALTYMLVKPPCNYPT